MEVIGVPFDLCGQRLGTRLGPAAVRLAGLAKTISEQGYEVADSGDVEVDAPHTEEGGIRNFKPAMACCKELKSRVSSALMQNRFPLVIGGDHTIAIGSLSAVAERFVDDVCYLWVDAHADMNTPATTPSGNMHGMSLAAAMGLESGVSGKRDEEWRQLLTEIVPKKPVRPDRTAFLGLRDVDPPEAAALDRLTKGYVATMYDIDRHGLVSCLLKFDLWMRQSGVRHLWISFDVDALDPFLAPGTGTAVRGGLSYREMHLLGEMLFELTSAKDCPYELIGLEVVETNPLIDVNNATAITAVEWMASLFGKTILGRRK